MPSELENNLYDWFLDQRIEAKPTIKSLGEDFPEFPKPKKADIDRAWTRYQESLASEKAAGPAEESGDVQSYTLKTPIKFKGEIWKTELVCTPDEAQEIAEYLI